MSSFACRVFLCGLSISWFLLAGTAHADLVAHWDFSDGKALDATAAGNDGVVYGAAKTSGKFGDGLHFDGNNDYVEVPNSPSFQFETNYTISAWVKPERDDNWWSLVAKVKDTQVKHFWFVQNDMGIAFEAETPNTSPYLSGGTMRIGQWNHVAVTMSSEKRVSLFVNGEKVAEESFGTASAADTTPINIGRSGGSYNKHYFKGDMDEVRIYDHALSEAEIRAEAGDSFNLAPVLTELLSASPEDPMADETVSFSLGLDDPEGDSVSYLWDFGDGQTEMTSAPSATHAFKSGRYVVYVYYADDLHPAIRSNPVVVTVGGSASGDTVGVVAHYPLDADGGTQALDAAGDSDGTLEGDATYVEGKIDGALQLSGDGYVDIPDTPALHALGADMSLGLWLKPADGKAGSGIVLKGGEGDIDKIQFGLGMDGGQYSFLWEPRFDTDFGTVEQDEWHHLMVTVGPDFVVTLYIDGQWAGQARGGNAPEALSAPLRLGRGEFRKRGKLRYFKGLMDDVRLYNYALNPTEVALLATGKLPTTTVGSGCNAGLVRCGGACVETASDPDNCGACGMQCDGEDVCSESECSSECSAGLMECGRACVDTSSSSLHCGKCDAACPEVDGATLACTQGTCEATACAPGFTDTDGNLDNGCEEGGTAGSGGPGSGSAGAGSLDEGGEGCSCELGGAGRSRGSGGWYWWAGFGVLGVLAGRRLRSGGSRGVAEGSIGSGPAGRA